MSSNPLTSDQELQVVRNSLNGVGLGICLCNLILWLRVMRPRSHPIAQLTLLAAYIWAAGVSSDVISSNRPDWISQVSTFTCIAMYGLAEQCYSWALYMTLTEEFPDLKQSHKRMLLMLRVALVFVGLCSATSWVLSPLSDNAVEYSQLNAQLFVDSTLPNLASNQQWLDAVNQALLFQQLVGDLWIFSIFGNTLFDFAVASMMIHQFVLRITWLRHEEEHQTDISKTRIVVPWKALLQTENIQIIFESSYKYLMLEVFLAFIYMIDQILALNVDPTFDSFGNLIVSFRIQMFIGFASGLLAHQAKQASNEKLGH